jgi:cytochrome oxidase Cu insertion factor (SCO1/SenC/PrrC family)
MKLRIVATVAIGLLLVLDIALPRTGMGRRGSEHRVRADVASAVGQVGEPLPAFSLVDLQGEAMSSDDLRGHRVLLTFERSVDW